MSDEGDAAKARGTPRPPLGQLTNLVGSPPLAAPNNIALDFVLSLERPTSRGTLPSGRKVTRRNRDLSTQMFGRETRSRDSFCLMWMAACIRCSMRNPLQDPMQSS